MITEYTPPCCTTSCVWYVKQNRRSKYSSDQAYSSNIIIQNTGYKCFNNYEQPYNMALATLTIKSDSKDASRPPDIPVGGLMFYHGFFLLISSLFSPPNFRAR